MKKIIIILAVITTGLALLFAQPPAEPEEAVVEQTPASKPALKPIAQPVVPPAKPAPEPTEPERLPEEEVKTDEASLSGEPTDDALITDNRISLLMKNAELKEIIEVFSRLSNANIIVPDLSTDKKVNRKMDVNLNNVEWKPALEAVLESQNLELYEKVPASKVYSIREKTPGAPEATNMKIFKLNYASADSVTNLLAQMVGVTGSYSIFPERNVVVAQATAKILQNIGDVMKQIDLPRQQVFIESKFLELSDKAQRDLGINWKVLEAYNVKASNLGLNYKKDDVSTDTDSQFFDIAGRKYEQATMDPVVDTPARPGSFGPDDSRVFGVTPTVENIDKLTTTKALTAVLGAEDFELILSALAQNDGADVVSNPKIIVANEEEAFIHLGRKEPNIRVERTSGTSDNPGGTTVVGLDDELPWFEDGVKVVVKPTINTASNIMVRITPELTKFGDFREVETGGTKVKYPSSTTKKIETIFSLESGQTAAIGGLTQVSESTKKNNIPWLGTLPLIGRFFSYEQMIKEQSETIIFVTVGLANPSSIDINTGLPENTRLAHRYAIREVASAQIDLEERSLLQTKETKEMEKELQDLRAANQKLIDKQAAKETKAVEKKAAEEAKAAEKEKAKADAVAAKLAKEEAAAQKLAEDIESEGRASSSAAAEAKAGEADPVAEDVSEVIAPVVAPVAELPVAEKTPSVEEIIESLEPAIEESGGGTATTNSTK